MTGRVRPSSTLGDPAEQLRTFRAYQRTGSYEDAAATLGLTVPQVKRRMLALYRRLGALNGTHASFLLRDEPW